MRIRITRTVPGYVDNTVFVQGDERETHEVTAVSLIEDGYAELMERAIGRATPAERREVSTAPVPGAPTRRGPGRPKKSG